MRAMTADDALRHGEWRSPTLVETSCGRTTELHPKLDEHNNIGSSDDNAVGVGWTQCQMGDLSVLEPDPGLSAPPITVGLAGEADPP